MKILKCTFAKKNSGTFLKSSKNLIELTNLSSTMAPIGIDLKDSIKWNKTKQDEVYFRQRSLKFKTTQTFLHKKKKKKKIKKSLAYSLFFKQEQKKDKNSISYTNLRFLKVYLTKYGKIRSRYITKLKIFQQSTISKLIRKARSYTLIPLKFNIFS